MDVTEQDAAPELGADGDAAEVARGQSLLDRAQQRREERKGTEEFNIPTWGGELLARYKVVPRRELNKIINKGRGKKGEAADRADVESDCDFLIKACVGIVARDIDTEEREEVASGYNEDLTRKLNKEDKIGSARELVLYMFSDKEGKANTVALGAHCMKVARWMQDPSRPVDDEDPS